MRVLPAHVARVWPLRKRDFRWKPSRFRAQTAIAGISVNGGRAPMTFNFRSAATFASPAALAVPDGNARLTFSSAMNPQATSPPRSAPNGLVDHIGGMAGPGIPARRQLACASEPIVAILRTGHHSAVRIGHEG